MKIYAVATGCGIALRDDKHRCLGTLAFRSWLDDESKREATAAVIRALGRGAMMTGDGTYNPEAGIEDGRDDPVTIEI